MAESKDEEVEKLRIEMKEIERSKGRIEMVNVPIEKELPIDLNI